MVETTILEVEDEVIIARDIQRTLIRLGYEVPTYSDSGEAALQHVASNRPDLVLMDIHLRGPMDGIGVADEIRRRYGLPVVYLTAHSDEATLQRAKITEPYGYVLKPFEERVLANGLIIDLSLDTVLVNREGMEDPVDHSAAPIRDESGAVTGVVSVFREISVRKYVAEKLRHFVVHDVLTGFPNQILLSDRLNRLLEYAKLYSNCRFALFFIDLDHFKNVNDSLGHVLGDLVLAAAAQRLAESLQGADTLARLDGDEFVMLLNRIGNPQKAAHAANRILNRMAEAILIDGYEVHLSASIGIVLSEPGFRRTAEDFLRDAAEALCQAKTQGGGRFSLCKSVFSLA